MDIGQWWWTCISWTRDCMPGSKEVSPILRKLLPISITRGLIMCNRSGHYDHWQIYIYWRGKLQLGCTQLNAPGKESMTLDLCSCTCYYYSSCGTEIWKPANERNLKPYMFRKRKGDEYKEKIIDKENPQGKWKGQSRTIRKHKVD